ncbi:MAG TPA: M14-type cytosolic carboxypeptidase [Candidatus Nanopelagicales bacterium]|nr:M14-type cytosolic carboxypeptidase [Candidatus Nanopelagicales bacterium]
MEIDAGIDSGAIVVHRARHPGAIELGLRGDTAAELRQWFHFQVRGAAGRRCRMRLADAGDASYPGGFGGGYRVAASYDGERWFRVPTRYERGVLTWQHTPREDACAYAYFAAHPYARQEMLLARAEASPRVRVQRLGESVLGRPIDVLTLGSEGRGGRRVWIVGRQHPGEAAAGWFMEGVLERLLDEDDPVVEELLGEALLHVVPNINPDGTALGNHRTNAAGRDLNREWLDPSVEESPEVWLVRRAMLEGGVDLFVDVHAEETLPYLFAARAEGIPGYTERLRDLEERFVQHLAGVDPDFQTEHGYDPDEPGEADLSIAGNWVPEEFDCLSLTLELPLNDNVNRPDPERGWSPERSKGFAGSVLESALESLPDLR